MNFSDLEISSIDRSGITDSNEIVHKPRTNMLGMGKISSLNFKNTNIQIPI